MNVAGTELDVFTYRPVGCKLQVILLVFDGQNRHGWAARNQTEFLANRFCGFIVAPQLEETRFPHNDIYEYGGLTRPPGHRTIDLIPPLAAWARAAVNAPRLPFVLLGHSSGAQFVSRVAAFSSTGAAGIVVANSSTWVLPSTTIASPFGLGRTEAATDDGLRAYLAQPITVLAGTDDTKRDGVGSHAPGDGAGSQSLCARPANVPYGRGCRTQSRLASRVDVGRGARGGTQREPHVQLGSGRCSNSKSSR